MTQTNSDMVVVRKSDFLGAGHMMVYQGSLNSAFRYRSLRPMVPSWCHPEVNREGHAGGE